ncbi:MAG: methyl-accepting chemotaxis protein [Bacteriovoracaceae bacterium]
MSHAIKLATKESGRNEVEETLQFTEETLAEVFQQLKVIEEIASKTDLLALNASIEAARVGKNGKGFTVVADEVSKLSEKTQRALTEINGTMEKLQSQLAKIASTLKQQ